MFALKNNSANAENGGSVSDEERANGIIDEWSKSQMNPPTLKDRMVAAFQDVRREEREADIKALETLRDRFLSWDGEYQMVARCIETIRTRKEGGGK